MEAIERNQEKQRGFTLVELLAAAGILVLLAAGLASSMVAGMRLNSYTRERDTAREAARTQMEQILSWGTFDTLADQFNGATFEAGTLPPIAGNDTAGTITIDTTNPDLVVVTVRVDWNGQNGDDGLELRTEIANIANN